MFYLVLVREPLNARQRHELCRVGFLARGDLISGCSLLDSQAVSDSGKFTAETARLSEADLFRLFGTHGRLSNDANMFE